MNTFLAFIFVLTMPAFAIAQANQSTPSTPVLQSSIATLISEEPPADAPYRLSPGDQIEVEVVGRTGLSGKHTIGPDGYITLPVVGSVNLFHKTRSEAATAIEDKLLTLYNYASVSVGVDEYSGNGVTVLGAVEHPGFIQTNGPPQLLDVLAKAGTLPPTLSTVSGPAPPAEVTAYPEECIIYRGQNKIISIQLHRLLEEENNLGNYRLMSGDTVYVPGRHKYVSILGEVKIPGQATLTSDSTIADLLARAGGLTSSAGNNPAIQIIHPSDGKHPGGIQLVSFNAIKAAKPLDVAVQSGDIIYVPESGFSHLGDTMQKISPLVSAFALGAILK